ncbi:hypothetical protein [Microbacterium sp. NPDC087665]|uniref:hypothetical protein n=1 Tax=Microbacterium sp. NPDC087665 TaxID=3364194 RepID=UPI0037FAB115
MPTLGSIFLELDRYGKFARASALADYLEILAIRNGSALVVDLEVSLNRAGWYKARRGMFTIDPDIEPDDVETLEGADGTESPDDPDWPEWATAVLLQRKAILGDRYPFQIERGSVTALSDWCGSDYVRLLALTAAHAYKADLTSDPRELFELLIVGSLRALGFVATGMGTATTHGRSFPEQLQISSSAVGLGSMATPYPAKTHAKDGGVDALGALNWGDRRPGQVSIIVQATLGESGTWERKIAEPKPHHWVNYLLEKLQPIVILAVPHHIENEQFNHLLEPHRTIVDRLRLVGKLDPPLTGEDEVLNWMLSCTIQ